MIQFYIKKFNQLTSLEVYHILQLRSAVFVVEQDCIYQDIDNKDQQAFHVLGFKNNQLIAYSRIFDSGDYFNQPSIGRIVIKQSERNFSYGHDLVDFSIQYILQNFKEKSILISAQLYLEKFYKSHGFNKKGKEYLEDGIPHIKMLRTY